MQDMHRLHYSSKMAKRAHQSRAPQRKTVENDNEPAGWVYCSGNWGRADSAQKQDHKVKSMSRKYSIGEKRFTGISDKFLYSPFHYEFFGEL